MSWDRQTDNSTGWKQRVRLPMQMVGGGEEIQDVTMESKVDNTVGSCGKTKRRVIKQ
jgi:hypothetical protein